MGPNLVTILVTSVCTRSADHLDVYLVRPLHIIISKKLNFHVKMYVGGHTLGFAHCSSFQNRIHNFATTQDVDPSMHPSFVASLRNVCPMHNKVKGAGANLDSTPTIFDNTYYKLLLEGKSIFTSDQALLTNPTTKTIVKKFANSREEFEKAFVESMIKMSSITGGGQEVRLNCRFVN